jgi:hypothetical protein
MKNKKWKTENASYLKNPSANPPSTGMTWPVVFDRRSDTSKKIASA